MLKPEHLRTLREVVRLGSFAAAANRLGYTSSAVSQQMAALERETGVRLFERFADVLAGVLRDMEPEERAGVRPSVAEPSQLITRLGTGGEMDAAVVYQVEVTLSLIAAGLGAALLPDLALRDHNPEVVVVDLPASKPSLTPSRSESGTVAATAFRAPRDQGARFLRPEA
ncbi:LysR family transcriptional regulator [Nonomuraea sp. NPDC049419]|uniref:helix-turn-helix domain-containing protein n=1 Tax=Nonomuraea sp. NPDC049419 TaxID=3155772 RepID=UPI003414C500